MKIRLHSDPLLKTAVANCDSYASFSVGGKAS